MVMLVCQVIEGTSQDDQLCNLCLMDRSLTWVSKSSIGKCKKYNVYSYTSKKILHLKPTFSTLLKAESSSRVGNKAISTSLSKPFVFENVLQN